jgi:hypothetical protein
MMPRALSDRRKQTWLAGFLGVALSGVILVWSLAPSHPDGDPGNVRHNALRTISVAIPSGSTILLHAEGGPTWSSCDGRPGTEGWSDVTNGFQFTSARPAKEVVAQAQAALKRAGWTQIPDHPSPLGPSARWTKTFSGNVLANAELAVGRHSAQDSFWALDVTAAPAATRTSGC